MMFDNYVLREKNRNLEAQVSGLEARVPKEGSAILSKPDGELFVALKALLKEGEKPEDIATRLKEHPLLVTEVAQLKMQTVAVQIAEAEGWQSSVLLELTKDMSLAIEEVEEEEDDPENEGKKVKVKNKRGFMVVKDDKGVETKTRLSERLKTFIPSLVKDEVEAGSEEGQSAAAVAGTPFVKQSQGGKVAPSTQKASTRVLGKYARRDKK